MTTGVSRVSVLLAVLTVCGNLSADDLDDALAAQKKKVQRRIYSDRAVLDSRQVVLPKTPTEQELALDKKLREMDAQLDIRSANSARSAPPPISRVVTMTPPSARDRNWLTSAVLDSDEELSLPDENENDWILTELQRQKEAKERQALIDDEDAAVGRLMRQKSRTPELDRLKDYEISPQRIISGENREPPPYLTPSGGLPDPVTTIRPVSKKERADTSLPLFSPAAVRARVSSPTATRSSLTPIQSISSPPQKSASISPRRNERKTKLPAPLAPIDQIRKFSPHNREDPFSDEMIPDFKTSIWQ
jgi:hypothetical protein